MKSLTATQKQKIKDGWAETEQSGKLNPECMKGTIRDIELHGDKAVFDSLGFDE
jgi:hypothetical protein